MAVDRTGPEGPEGPSGPQGKRGARGLTAEPAQGERGPAGERGPCGKAGSRMKVPRRIFIGYLLIVMVSVVSAGLSYKSYAEVQDGRRVSSDAVCAFGSALAEAGRAILDASAAPPKDARARRFERELERLGYPPRKLRQGAGQAYIDSIATRVAAQTGVKGLVVKTGPTAGRLDCAKLRKAANIQ